VDNDWNALAFIFLFVI